MIYILTKYLFIIFQNYFIRCNTTSDLTKMLHLLRLYSLWKLVNLVLPSIINTMDSPIEEDRQMIIQCRFVKVGHYYVLLLF